MKTALRRLVTLSGVVVAMFLPAQPAQALATLKAKVVGATCTVTTSEGTTTAVPCSADSWVVALQPGWSAEMVARIEYAYADDGLPLAPLAPGIPGGWFQMDESGLGTRLVDHEAGALYVFTSNCGFYCAGDGDWAYTGWSGFPPVFLSDNDEADRLNGTLTVSTGASFSPSLPNYPGSWTANIHMGLSQSVYSIPEPSTYVLMLLGLGALASAARRRSQSTVNR